MIQIDMEMPKDCSECKLRIDEPPKSYCALTYSYQLLGNERPSWCPLQEVKEVVQ